MIALVWIPLWLWFFKDNPKDSSWVSKEELALIEEQEKSHLNEEDTQAISWKFLFSNPTLLANNWAFFVFGYYLFFFMTWLPSFLSDRYHIELKTIGLYSILPWLMAVVMMWGTGVLGDFLFCKTKSYRISRSYLIIGSQLLATICVIPICMQTDLTSTILFISLAVGFIMSANASYYAVNIDIAKGRVGTSLGIMDAVFAVAGVLAPVITGYLVDISGHFNAAFYLLIALGISSSIITLLFHNKSAKLSQDR